VGLIGVDTDRLESTAKLIAAGLLESRQPRMRPTPRRSRMARGRVRGRLAAIERSWGTEEFVIRWAFPEMA
jgi:hypothetical protein